VQLGEGGPELVVEMLEVAPLEPAAAPAQPVRRSFGGKGRTVFFREIVDESTRRSAARIRVVVWTFVGLLVVAVGALWWYAEQRVRRASETLTAQQEASWALQQAAADSLRRAAGAEYERLRLELEQARAGSAPAAVVESLRLALAESQQRTAAVETALGRAQTQLAGQLAAGDSLQRRADAELRRLRAELGQAAASQVSSGLLDSLRRALSAAQERANSIEAQMRAVRGVNLAALAQANQAAVGLVSVFAGGEVFDGSGFAVTRSGYFITNRHVVAPDGRAADSVFVTMADQRFMTRAAAVGIAPPGGPDLAVLKLADYQGPRVARVDWNGTGAGQGEPAALIGFPAGVAAALDETRTVRTSMSAGIFSKVTGEQIQFDGFTVGGSSGSPIFNANGDVVAVHRAGLREAAGLGFAVPIRAVLSLLPPEAKAELGVR
jgi:S1-C subfamily serine protease